MTPRISPIKFLVYKQMTTDDDSSNVAWIIKIEREMYLNYVSDPSPSAQDDRLK